MVEDTYRDLTLAEITALEHQGCRCGDWQQVRVAEEFEATNVCRVRFEGEIRLGKDVHLDNVGIIRTTDGATFGEDVLVSVKNEDGNGNVVLFSALSAQFAALMVRTAEKGDQEAFAKLRQMVSEYVEAHKPECTTIGNGVTITDSRELTNVNIGEGSELCGVSRMIDCTLLAATAEASIFVGDNVICENVIMQAGATVVDGARLYDTFVGEACHIGRGFTSEKSLFFANSHMDNGEACAALCGPFSVSHHKSTLLIGGEHSFYNAGSNTNFSNHAYKMGPIHHGIMERGAKTASGAHILWPAHIGAFSMVMGKVQTHPDTQMLPFSYVIGEGRGCHIVPGRNLCTVGTYRDVGKWVKRDARPKDGRLSLITYDWLSPYTVEHIRQGIKLLQRLQDEQGSDAQEYRGKGYTISAKALYNGIRYYRLALRMYGKEEDTTAEWTDLLGLYAPVEEVKQLLEDVRNGEVSSVEEVEERFADMFHNYEQWKGEVQNEATAEEARKEWLETVRCDAEKEYEMGDVSKSTLNRFIETLK